MAVTAAPVAPAPPKPAPRPAPPTASEIRAVWIEFVSLYRDRPIEFVREVLKVEPDEWQAELLNAIARGRRRIACRSGHGVGKSTVVAWAMIWYLSTRYPVKVVVTAPTAGQLFDALFAEVKRWLRVLPREIGGLFETTSERVELKAAPNESFISARTSRTEKPEALQGVHSEHVMLVADEASGVPEAVFEAAAGSMSGFNAVTLLLGNPVRSSGFFYDVFTRLSDEWTLFHVSCLDCKRVSSDYIEDMKSRYGEDSNAYRIRVLGEFPKADDDTVIPMELLELAKMRDVLPVPSAPRVWGVDVARFGSDSSVLVRRKGNWVEEPQIWRGLDLMQLTGALVNEYTTAKSGGIAPVEILIDVIGVGAGVVDRCRELNMPVRGVNVSESPALATRYQNLRAEIWFQCREWLSKRDCKLPTSERLIQELASVRYAYTSSGKIQIESKDQMRKRGRGSPDAADALCLTFASSAATAVHGWSFTGSRATAVRRSIKGIV